MMMNNPGPRNPTYLPSRRSATFSHCRTTLMANKRYKPATVPAIAGQLRCMETHPAAPAATLTSIAVTATPLTGKASVFFMASSPANRLCDQSAQLFDQFLDAEPGRPGPRHRIFGDPSQLPCPFFVASTHLLRADKSAGSLVRFQQSSQLELAIGANHGVGIDGQVDGKLSYRGQLVAGSEGSGSHPAPDLVDDLAIHRYAAMQVEPEPEWRPSGIHRHDAVRSGDMLLVVGMVKFSSFCERRVPVLILRRERR